MFALTFDGVEKEGNVMGNNITKLIWQTNTIVGSLDTILDYLDSFQPLKRPGIFKTQPNHGNSDEVSTMFGLPPQLLPS